jgi:hypothetical protein
MGDLVGEEIDTLIKFIKATRWRCWERARVPPLPHDPDCLALHVQGVREALRRPLRRAMGRERRISVWSGGLSRASRRSAERTAAGVAQDRERGGYRSVS